MLQRFKRDGLKLTGWRIGGELSGFRLFHGRICIENSELFRPRKRRKVPKSKGFRNFPRWQGQKDLNPRHSVLETDALPTELYPYIAIDLTKSEPSAAGPIWEGKRSQRRCSFHGAFANRGNGTELAASDVVVDRQGLEPRTDRL